MRRNLTIMVLAIATLFLSTNLIAAGIDLTGQGARAQALGGNYRAIADDWSALYWNPAGMAFTEGWTSGFSSELIKVSVGYTPGQIGGMQFSALNTSKTENEPKTYFVPSGGIYKSNGKFAYGVGVWASFGLGAKWDLMNTSGYNSSYPSIDYDDDLMVLIVQPTVAYKLSDKFSLGLGVGLVNASIKIQKPNFTPNPYVFDSRFAATQAALSPAGGLNPEYNHILTDTNLEGDGMGFTINAGLMFKATKCLTIGATMQYYSTITLDGEVDANTYLPDNPTANGAVLEYVKPSLDDMLANGMLDMATYQTLVGMYSGAQVTKANGQKITADMPLPMRLGVGVAWNGIENLIVSADVAYTQWSVWDVIDIEDENTGAKFSELREEWEDGVRFGVGAEYDFGPLVGRASWYTEPNAAVEETMTPSIPDFGRRQVVIAGIGLPVGPFMLHASYEKIMVGDSVVEDWNYDSVTQGYHNLAGQYDMNINIVMFGMDYRF